MPARAQFTIDLRGFDKLEAQIKAGGNGSQPLHAMYRAWAVRYFTYVQRRANRLGRNEGGGEWEPLALSTLRARARKARRSGTKRGRRASAKTVRATIMQDTGRLVGALEPGAPGNEITVKDKSVVAALKQQGHSTGLTFAKLAEYHADGNSKLPARPLFVEPDDRTRRGMLRDAAKAYSILIRGAGI